MGFLTGVIQWHENSQEHRTALLTYQIRRKGTALVSKLEEQIKTEQQYMQQVIDRVFQVIATIIEHGLAPRFKVFSGFKWVTCTQLC